MGEKSAGEKLANLANCELLACQYSQIHRKCIRHMQCYALIVAYLPKFSLPIAFICIIHQNFPPPNLSCGSIPALYKSTMDAGKGDHNSNIFTDYFNVNSLIRCIGCISTACRLVSQYTYVDVLASNHSRQ